MTYVDIMQLRRVESSSGEVPNYLTFIRQKNRGVILERETKT